MVGRGSGRLWSQLLPAEVLYRVGVEQAMLDFVGGRIGADGPKATAYTLTERELALPKVCVNLLTEVGGPLAVDSSFSSPKITWLYRRD